MSDKNVTKNGKYYRKVVYYEDEFHNRYITIAVLLSNTNDIYVGMSICCPQDKEKRDLGRHISKGRAESRYEQTSKHSKAVRAINVSHSGGLHSILQEDDFFLKQIGRSYFYDFKHNPQKYIASYETS